MFGLGPWELLLIFLAVLLLFGAKRLPEIAQGMGKGIKEFRKAMKDTTDEIKGSLDADDSKSKTNSEDKKNS
jgi:sec-independent protein translocase protein TatA